MTNVTPELRDGAGKQESVLQGACLLAGSDGISAWRLLDGRVCLDASGTLHVIERDATLRLEYGGLSAAVGIVPLAVVLTEGDRRTVIVDEEFDVYASDTDPDQARARYVEVLAAAARASGATLVVS